MARYSAKHEEAGKNNENVYILTGIVLLAIFNAMTGYFLYTSLNKIEDLSSVAVGLNQLLFGVFGVAMIILGSIMPKLHMNSCVGLRTVWSMKNETTWKKSQRFGGISFVLAGAIIVLISCFAKGIICTLWSLGILCICTFVDVVYSYKTAKKY